MRRSIITALAFSALCLAASSARAETWRCEYVGSWLTTATGNTDDFAWGIKWDKTPDGWALTGNYTDKYGQSYFDGRCANRSCDFYQKYTSGKLSGKTYYYTGTYVNKTVQSTSSITVFNGTWGYSADAKNAGNWKAVATCKKD